MKIKIIPCNKISINKSFIPETDWNSSPNKTNNQNKMTIVKEKGKIIRRKSFRKYFSKIIEIKVDFEKYVKISQIVNVVI